MRKLFRLFSEALARLEALREIQFSSFQRKLESRVKFFAPFVSALLGMAISFRAFALDTGLKPIENTEAARSAICNVFNFMFWTLISISVAMVLWAAYLYATAQEDAEKTSTARRVLLYSAIGIIVAFLAKGFPLMVAGIFPGGTSGIKGC